TQSTALLVDNSPARVLRRRQLRQGCGARQHQCLERGAVRRKAGPQTVKLAKRERGSFTLVQWVPDDLAQAREQGLRKQALLQLLRHMRRREFVHSGQDLPALRALLRLDAQLPKRGSEARIAQDVQVRGRHIKKLQHLQRRGRGKRTRRLT